MKSPNFFIVGAPKCGTTALFSYLGEHPEIYIPSSPDFLESSMGGKKELHFFGSDLLFNRPSLEEYLAYYRNAKEEKHLGESSVFYLYSSRAASEIYDFCPSARIIIMLRNPIDMMYSWYSQLLFWGDENLDNFEAALNAESQRRSGENVPVKRDHPIACYLYRDIAKYTEQIERYFQIFGREKVHIVIFDDFKKDTKETYQSALRFLDCTDEAFEPDFKVVNANKAIRNRSLQEFMRHPPKFSRLLVKALMPYFIRKEIRQKLQQYNIKAEARKSLHEDLRRRLNEEYKYEVEQLSQLLDRDLTHWVSF
jgi:Sulfotransferase family